MKEWDQNVWLRLTISQVDIEKPTQRAIAACKQIVKCKVESAEPLK